MTIRLYCGRRMGLGVSKDSSFVKSKVSLGVASGAGSKIGSEYLSDAGKSFKTASMTLGGMMIGTCLGLRLLKPPSYEDALE